MKKFLGYLAMAMALLAMPISAQAAVIYGWDFDLTSWGGSVISDVQYLSVSGQGSINQSFGGDGTLDVGDPFTATSVMYTVSMTTGSGIVLPSFVNVDGTSNYLYFKSDNLAGHISAINPDGSFEYVYTSGDVQLLAGDYDDPSNSVVIADMSIETGEGEASDNNLIGNFLSGEADLIVRFLTDMSIETGEGEASDNNLIGNFLSGEADLIVRFLTNLLGTVITFDPSLYPGLGGYPNLSSFFVFDLTNNLVPGSAIITSDGFIADFSTAGDVTLVATPEPSTFVILGLGLLGLIGFRRKFNF